MKNHVRLICVMIVFAALLVSSPAFSAPNEKQVLAAMSALRGRDTAFVVVTHDPAIAQRMDRQLTLANGRLEAR